MSKLTKFTLISALALGFSVPAATAETLTVTSSSPPNSPPSVVLKEWGEKLSEATDGELQLEFYWQQSLSKLADNLDAISAGLADLGPVVPAYSRQKLPLNYLSSTSTGSGDPWVISQAWRETRDEFPAITEEERAAGVKFLAIESIGPVIFVGNKFYKSPDDFQNATMRLSSHYAFAAQDSGWDVNPARIRSPETYTSLEKGTITGATTYANQLYPFKLNEVADFITRMNLGQHSNMYYVGLDTWERLSEEHRAAIEETLPWLNEAFARAEVREAQMVYEEIQKDETYPMKVYDVTAEEREIWSDALEPSYDNNVSKAEKVNPAAPQIAEAYRSNIDEAEERLSDNGYPWK